MYLPMEAIEKLSVESGQGTDLAEESLLFAGGGWLSVG